MVQREGITLVTQNVDGLHEAAADACGAPQPLGLHGSIFRVRCTDCGSERSDREPVDATSLETLPRCSGCGALLRPAVVWFGEALPEDTLRQAIAAAERADVCLVIGTSGTVQPAAALANHARSGGATLIVVDPGATEYDTVADIRLSGSADEVVPAILGRPHR
jgi:NAD-dependent deacetylase